MAGREQRCATCAKGLDAALHALCEVCGGALYCVPCARDHYCTGECEARGCIRGLCVKLVRDGAVATEFGIPAEP